MVEIDENTLLYIGGDDAANNYNEVFKYTIGDNTWAREEQAWCNSHLPSAPTA